MAGEDDRNPRIGWRHEWGTLVLLWIMVVWVSVTILGTRGAAASYVTLADLVVVGFALAGGVLATLTIVRAARIPMLSAPVAVLAVDSGAADTKDAEDPDDADDDDDDSAVAAVEDAEDPDDPDA